MCSARDGGRRLLLLLLLHALPFAVTLLCAINTEGYARLYYGRYDRYPAVGSVIGDAAVVKAKGECPW